MLTFGVVVLGVTDRQRAIEFWRAALGYQVREDGFGGWATVLVPPGGTGTMIALQRARRRLRTTRGSTSTCTSPARPNKRERRIA